MNENESVIDQLIHHPVISRMIRDCLRREKTDLLLQYVETYRKVPSPRVIYETYPIGRFYKKLKHGQNQSILQELMRNDIIFENIARFRHRKTEREQKQREERRRKKSPLERRLSRKTYKELQEIASRHQISYKESQKHLTREELLKKLVFLNVE